jgi:hypothetical protein
MTPTPPADDTTVVGLITDETAYREEVRDLAVWCRHNKAQKIAKDPSHPSHRLFTLDTAWQEVPMHQGWNRKAPETASVPKP